MVAAKITKSPKAGQRKWTIEEAKLIKKLREERLSWTLVW
jgi:hypothetical protein